MWKLQAILVQLLLLVCVLRLYFQPGELEYPKPQKTLPEMGLQPPAARLVLFLVEGLRADTFFGSNFQQLPHLKELLSHHGLVGVSRTTIPTLTRTGKVALLGGFYDVPSLVTDDGYDTIYNRTWSAPNTVVLDFSGHPRKVYEMLEASLKDVDTYNRLRIATRSVITLQMKGLIAESPLDERYLVKFRNAQWTVREAYHMIERVFADRATAYLMTSAHGLTDLGEWLPWGGGLKVSFILISVQDRMVEHHSRNKLLPFTFGELVSIARATISVAWSSTTAPTCRSTSWTRLT